MIDFQTILASLQAEASKVAEQVAEAVELDRRVAEGTAAAEELAVDVKQRLETDPAARLAAAGAGGLLLAGLLGTSGGRKIIGGVAKTGIVAALGALAYRTWQGRKDESPGEEVAARAAGYVGEDNQDAQFSEAIVRVMIAAAYADGVLDEEERRTLTTKLAALDASPEERALLVAPQSNEALYERIVYSALSPNHAAQLYAAASVVAGVRNDAERSFLRELAERLGVDHRHAKAMDEIAQ